MKYRSRRVINKQRAKVSGCTFRTRVIRQKVSLKMIVFSLETPCWSPSEGLEQCGRKPVAHKDRTDVHALVDVANDLVFPRTLSQRSSLHKRKITTKTRGIAHNCNDLTCTKKYALTEGLKRGREVGGGAD